MKKRLFSILTALALCLTLLPTAALAAGETTYLWQTSDNKIYTSTTAPSDVTASTGGTEFTTSTFSDANYQLLTDITVSSTIQVIGTVTLDLNGYVLKMTGSGSVIRVGNSSATPATTGSLTLTDSNSSATHYFTEDNTTHLWSLCTATGCPHDHNTVLGGIITGGTGTGTASGAKGGGVFVDTGSTFTMSGGNIVGCTAANGGSSVYVCGGGSDSNADKFTMSGGSIRGCTASNGNGGGVLLENPGAQFEMSGGTIASCTANNGGGVSAGGETTFNMSGSATISNCTAKGFDGDGGKGGGVNVGGTFNMSGGTIETCAATGGSSGGGAAQGGGVYVNSNNCTLQGGTISNCSATGFGVGGPKGGGVFVFEGKTLTVGGGSTALTITGNKSGATTPDTDDNIYLGTDSSTGSATITVASGGLAAGSSISLTPSTASDLNLSSATTDIGTLAANGYTWNATTHTLTLQNKILGNITLPSKDTKIIIQGDVIVNSIGDASFANKLTIEGSGTDPNLTVNERIACATNTDPLTLKNVTATVGCVNWNHSDPSTAQGLKLEKSRLTVNGIEGTGIVAGNITLDLSSTIELKDGHITGNSDSALSNVPSYCPTSGYTIGPAPGSASDDSSPTRYLLDPSGNIATDLILSVQGDPIPYTTTVRQGGSEVPPDMTFELELFAGHDSTLTAPLSPSDSMSFSGHTIDTNGAGKTSGTLRLAFSDTEQSGQSSDSTPGNGSFTVAPSLEGGIFVRQKQNAPENWEFDDAVYYVIRSVQSGNSGTDDGSGGNGGSSGNGGGNGGAGELIPDIRAILNLNDPLGREIGFTPNIPNAPSNNLDGAEDPSTPTLKVYTTKLVDKAYVRDKECTRMTFTNTYTAGSTGGGGGSGATYHTIKASAGTGGSISPAGNVSVRRNDDKTFTVTPDTGYIISNVLVDGKSVGAVSSYTFKSVRANHTIEARFTSASTPALPIIPADLNSTDHTAYVQGFADGLVRPNAPITRAQTAVMLYRLLTPERRAEIETDVHPFTDMTAQDWYCHEVATMVNGGYISGFSDGTFRGDAPITRAQFVAILTRFIGVWSVDCDFTDVPESHWAYTYIATATSAGWISGFADGSFRPEQTITRAQVMTIINRALNRGVDAESTLPAGYQNYPDNPATAWHYYEVLEATNGHDYTGSRPSEDWTALR